MERMYPFEVFFTGNMRCSFCSAKNGKKIKINVDILDTIC